ncbi:hypothetical protein [Hymenobacter volaticus]|uniref:MFS transporter n=1 Tax=Hymenobacter volaticus TaxID=2932254 RepID=A0ABY4GAR4_9BACT|nr:hypothetical protein [Hymenobacter volaticus]UOQ67986.1 hypothetical protein MUN86_09075 [Hymenobacter volaticus]
MSTLCLFLLCVTVIAAAVIQLTDTSSMNVALSRISGNPSVTLTNMPRVITAYAIANVITIPITSFLAALLYRVICSVYGGVRAVRYGLQHLDAGGFLVCTGHWGKALLSTAQTIVFEAFPQTKRGLASALFGSGPVTVSLTDH